MLGINKLVDCVRGYTKDIKSTPGGHLLYGALLSIDP